MGAFASLPSLGASYNMNPGFNPMRQNPYTVGNRYTQQWSMGANPGANPPGGFASALGAGAPVNQPIGDLNSRERGVLSQNNMALEPIEGDSLTQYLRSLFNMGAQQYQGLMAGGTQGVGQAMDMSKQAAGALGPAAQTFGGLLPAAGQAMGAYGQMAGGLTPALNYYQGIMKGGPDAMMALSPEIQQTQNSFQAAKRQLATTGPMGGGRASAMAQLPFQQGAAISNLYSQARPAAAQQLAALGQAGAGGLAGLGLGGAQGLSQIGQFGLQNFSNLGLGEQGMARDLLGLILSGQLQRRGQNVTESGQNKSMASDMLGAALGGTGALLTGIGKL